LFKLPWDKKGSKTKSKLTPHQAKIKAERLEKMLNNGK
jgi:hypothetical protein